MGVMTVSSSGVGFALNMKRFLGRTRRFPVPEMVPPLFLGEMEEGEGEGDSEAEEKD